MKSKLNGTLPEKLVSRPSSGNAKVNFTVKVQSSVILGTKNLLCLDNSFEFASSSDRDENAKVFLANMTSKAKDHIMSSDQKFISDWQFYTSDDM